MLASFLSFPPLLSLSRKRESKGINSSGNPETLDSCFRRNDTRVRKGFVPTVSGRHSTGGFTLHFVLRTQCPKERVHPEGTVRGLRSAPPLARLATGGAAGGSTGKIKESGLIIRYYVP